MTESLIAGAFPQQRRHEVVDLPDPERLAQEDGVSRVATAVRRLTSEPAEFFGLDAGRLEVGAAADIAVVDPQALKRWDPERTVEYVWRDCFAHHQLVNRPEGVVAAVVVGGKLLWRDGAYLPVFGVESAGRVLRHREHGVVSSAASALVA